MDMENNLEEVETINITEELSVYDIKLNNLKDVVCDPNITEPITKALCSDIEKAFFSREYTTLSDIRLNRISEYLRDKKNIYKQYIDAVSKDYDITISEEYDDIEALKIVLLIEEFQEIIKIETDKPVSYVPTLEEKNTRLSQLLEELEESEKNKKIKVETNNTILSEYDKADMTGKINILYDKIKTFVSSDDILDTYIDSLYNPSTTTLDQKNLLINLIIVSEMLNYRLGWEFTTDEKRLKVSNTEINLSNDWWDTILNNETMCLDSKHVKIVEKDLKNTFYSAWFGDIFKNANKLAVSDAKLKLNNLLGTDITYSNLLLDTVYEKTEKGSTIFITENLVSDFVVEDEFEDPTYDEKTSLVKLLGSSRGRDIYMLRHKNIKGMSKLKDEVITLNLGNKWLIDPTKPIIYFHHLENPYLDRGMIKWYALADFNIDMAKSNRILYDSKLLEN